MAKNPLLDRPAETDEREELEDRIAEELAALHEDPWAHRAHNMRCATCMAYMAKATIVKDGSATQVGRCRRHAPTLQGWPAVFPSDWCLDHKLDEEKL